jgi:hypothetical protein
LSVSQSVSQSFGCQSVIWLSVSYSVNFRLLTALKKNNPAALLNVAQAEQQLLKTYKVQFKPQTIKAADHQSDPVSIQILRAYHPVVLTQKCPLKSIGDGNCLFRTVSMLVSNKQDNHILLRLLVALELIKHSDYYSNENFFKDSRLFQANFKSLLQDALTIYSSCELAHIYALTQQTIYMGPIWVPCGHLYGPHVGCQHGTQMGSATGLHMGPIWAAPYTFMGHIGPI